MVRDILVSSLPMLIQGAGISLGLAIVSMVIGLVIGLVSALLRLFGPALLRRLVMFYVSLIRGTPLLVQLYVVYYGLPQVGITIGPWTSAIFALSVNVGAYLSETLRAAINTVPRGQWEAAESTGLTPWQTFLAVIAPQAAVSAIPPMANSFISLVKDTSLVSIIAVVELLRAAQLVIARTYQPIALYLAASVLYWILSEGLAFGQRALEKRATRHMVEA